MAPNSMMAAEMAIIRITHVADLPSPEELVRKLQNTTPPPAPSGGGHGGGMAPSGGAPMAQSGRTAPSGGGGGSPVTALATDTDAALARFPPG